MVASITVAGLGLLACVLGIINMTGNISSLHSYHRKRVTEEERKPFGKLVGLGTLLVGIAMVVFGVLFLMFEKTQLDLYVILGTILLIAGIVAGMAISFYAMMKYNKGIF